MGAVGCYCSRDRAPTSSRCAQKVVRALSSDLYLHFLLNTLEYQHLVSLFVRASLPDALAGE
jgi:hypothetical protein